MRKLVFFVVAVAAGSLSAGMPEKWFFWNQHLETDRQMSDFSNAVARASAAGYDKILLSCGEDYWSCWPDASAAARCCSSGNGAFGLDSL